MSSLWATLTGLLSHDQASANSRWGFTLPVHSVPGVLQQPGHHAETHQVPRSAGFPPWLEHQQHLPLHLTYLSQASPHRCIYPQHKVLIGVALIWESIIRCYFVSVHYKRAKHLFSLRINPA